MTHDIRGMQASQVRSAAQHSAVSLLQITTAWSCCCDRMSEPNPQQLQRHKDTVKDTLQGLLDTVAQIPGLIHDASSKEVIGTALLC